MIGPCMCGDVCCSSCGPAQGNFRCVVCGAWASEGCQDPDRCERERPAAEEAQRRMDLEYCVEMAVQLAWEAEHRDEIEEAVRSKE